MTNRHHTSSVDYSMSTPNPSVIVASRNESAQSINTNLSDDFDIRSFRSPSTISNPTSPTKKTVRFSANAAGPRETVLAVSITRFDHLENQGYTEYTIQLYRNSRLWSIQRRYRHFEQLLKSLKKENITLKQNLPTLPQKRWFEARRWLNRFEDNYSYDRQVALQIFLRTLVKNPVILQGSKALKEFLELDEKEDLSIPDYEATRDRNIIYYEVEDPEDEDYSNSIPNYRLTGIESFPGIKNWTEEFEDYSSDGDRSSSGLSNSGGSGSIGPMLTAVAVSLAKVKDERKEVEVISPKTITPFSDDHSNETLSDSDDHNDHQINVFQHKNDISSVIEPSSIEPKTI